VTTDNSGLELSLGRTDSPQATHCRPSPNFGARRGHGEAAADIRFLILHYTGMETARAALDWLCAPESEVSAHYFVDEDGTITQCVAEAARAWHAGAGSWRGETDINSHSIGIEIVNPGHAHDYRSFPDAQIGAVIRLCRDIVTRHGIEPRHVLAHSDTAPARKEDPGELFPWDRLHAAGVGHYVPPAPLGDGRFFQEGDSGQPVEALQTMLGIYGYGLAADGHFGVETRAVVTAFQRHFRPERVDGVADSSTIQTLHQLLRALETPV